MCESKEELRSRLRQKIRSGRESRQKSSRCTSGSSASDSSQSHAADNLKNSILSAPDVGADVLRAVLDTDFQDRQQMHQFQSACRERLVEIQKRDLPLPDPGSDEKRSTSTSTSTITNTGTSTSTKTLDETPSAESDVVRT